MYFKVLLCLTLSFELLTVLVSCELRLVNVLFRHGDRTPGNFIKTYSNDPNANNTFYPMGFGGLTNNGKLRVYNFGNFLRSTYDDYLGKVYLSHQVEAVSSDSPRARMSLQMLLASLYPPSEIQQWHEETNWQPVLMSYKPKEEDTFFVPQFCEEYQTEYKRVEKSSEFQAQVNDLRSFTDKLTRDMGRAYPVNLLDMNHLYHTFAAESYMNLSIPDWGKEIFPNGQLRTGTILQYKLYGYNDKLKRLSGGVKLHKIIQNMKDVQRNSSAESNCKIHLYSGHELNIVMLLQALGLYKDHIPEYSSSVIIELHELNKQFYVKVFYYHGIPAKLDVQLIPGCPELCPFETFIKLLKNVIPSENELRCNRAKEQ